MTRYLTVILGLVLGSSNALAQSHQPYAGIQSRQIKAFSEEQLADLRAGRGMSLALPAELNGYPGPLHVIELTEALALTDTQRDRMQQLLKNMKSEAIALGDRLINQETDLDRQFAMQAVTVSTLDVSTTAIGQTHAQLRAAHLRYHMLTVEVLTPDQVQRYIQLRGYAGGAPETMHQPSHHR